MSFKIFFFIISFIHLSVLGQEAPVWVHPASKNVQTIFYQGMNNSQTQGAKYTGTHGFIATTGEHVVNPYGIDVIQNIYVKPEIDEVIPASTLPLTWSDISLYPKSIFYAACKRMCHMGARYAHYHYGTHVKAIKNQKPEQTIAAHALNVSKINVAQEGDIANHKKRFEQCQKEYPEADMITYGVSRGAATTFQAVAQLCKDGIDISRIKLCILEGCFDSVESVMKKHHPWLLKNESSMNFFARIASKLISFKKDGPAPIKVAQDFPKNIPVAFITSLKDTEVPAQCTKNLIKELLKSGHKNIYLLQLKNSSHPRYMFDNQVDTTTYQNFIHALYAHYDLPHIPEYALAGKDMVEQCKIQEIEQL